GSGVWIDGVALFHLRSPALVLADSVDARSNASSAKSSPCGEGDRPRESGDGGGVSTPAVTPLRQRFALPPPPQGEDRLIRTCRSPPARSGAAAPGRGW